MCGWKRREVSYWSFTTNFSIYLRYRNSKTDYSNNRSRYFSSDWSVYILIFCSPSFLEGCQSLLSSTITHLQYVSFSASNSPSRWRKKPWQCHYTRHGQLNEAKVSSTRGVAPWCSCTSNRCNLFPEGRLLWKGTLHKSETTNRKQNISWVNFVLSGLRVPPYDARGGGMTSWRR